MALSSEQRQALVFELTTDNFDRVQREVADVADATERWSEALRANDRAILTNQRRELELKEELEDLRLAQQATRRESNLAQAEGRQTAESTRQAAQAQSEYAESIERVQNELRGVRRERARQRQDLREERADLQEVTRAQRAAERSLRDYQQAATGGGRFAAARDQFQAIAPFGLPDFGALGGALLSPAGLAAGAAGIGAVGAFAAVQQANTAQEQLRQIQEFARRTGLAETQAAQRTALIQRLGIYDAAGFGADLTRDVRENIGILEVETAAGRGSRLEAAQRVGLNISDLAGLDTLQQVEVVMRRIANSGLNVALQQETIAALFGAADERAQEFYNALDRSGESLAEHRRQTEDAAFTDQEQINRVEALTRAEAELQIAFDQLRTQALLPILPLMTGFAEGLTDLIDLIPGAGGPGRRGDEIQRLQAELEAARAGGIPADASPEVLAALEGRLRSERRAQTASEFLGFTGATIGSLADILTGQGSGRIGERFAGALGPAAPNSLLGRLAAAQRGEGTSLSQFATGPNITVNQNNVINVPTAVAAADTAAALVSRATGPAPPRFATLPGG